MMLASVQRAWNRCVDETYSLDVLRAGEEFVFRLNHEAGAVIEQVVPQGSGVFSYGGTRLQTGPLRTFTGNLERILDEKERDELVISDCVLATIAIDRMLQRAEVPTYMARAYGRMAGKLSLPTGLALSFASRKKLAGAAERIGNFEAGLESGSQLHIDVAALRPLTCSSGVLSYVFPWLGVYETGCLGAHDFRESLHVINTG